MELPWRRVVKRPLWDNTFKWWLIPGWAIEKTWASSCTPKVSRLKTRKISTRNGSAAALHKPATDLRRGRSDAISVRLFSAVRAMSEHPKLY